MLASHASPSRRVKLVASDPASTACCAASGIIAHTKQMGVRVKDNNLYLLLAVAAIAVLAALIKGAKGKQGNQEQPPRAKKLMTEREQAMYSRLVQTFPDCVTLSQVSLGALLTARTQGARNRFDRKIADFVLCDRSFGVIAVIELDDSSHAGKASQDKARDEMLAGAGYRTARFKNVPDVAELKQTIERMSAAQTFHEA